MCLYPRLIKNPKYKRTKKNGGIIPPVTDQRVQYVPVGCNTCLECRKQNMRNWQIRLTEDIKEHKNGKFVTLTFNTKSLVKLLDDNPHIQELKGYDADNAIATRAMRLFLERWRKKYKKSLRHFFVTELGHGQTEHIHLHGIVWCDDISELEKIWSYGFVWCGDMINEKLQNYVNARTIGYIVKYINKMDAMHLNYKPIILTSAGIGRIYATSGRIRMNRYLGKKTSEYYRTETGHKLALPIYYRNKIYSDREREQLWLMKLDKNERWVCGEKVDLTKGEELYYHLLDYHRTRTIKLGYPPPEFIWKKKKYEEERRELIRRERRRIIQEQE